MEVKPTEQDIEFKKLSLEQIKTKYDMSKLEKLEKFELIDIVHKAKCGKLKGLDTTDMTKEQLVEHLYNSKCPEVHSMLIEITDFKNEIVDFAEKYIEAGREITIDQVYYSGLQKVLYEVFFYDAWKNRKYDCILRNDELQVAYSKFTFEFSLPPYDKYAIQNVEFLADEINKCIDKGVKIIAIPISYKTGDEAHANAIIYRVDSNTFERLEPHGSFTQFSPRNLEKEATTYLSKYVTSKLVYEKFSYKHKGETKEKSFQDKLLDNFSSLSTSYNLFAKYERQYNKKMDDENKKKMDNAEKAYIEVLDSNIKNYPNEIITLIKKSGIRYNKHMIQKVENILNKGLKQDDIDIKLKESNELMKKHFNSWYEKMVKVLKKDYSVSQAFLDYKQTPMYKYFERRQDTIKLKLGKIEPVSFSQELNEYYKEVFEVMFPKESNTFKGCKYSAPNITNLVENGLQSIEPKDIIAKYKMTDEMYQDRIGGFCLLWSIMYFDLVFKFPDASTLQINEELLNLLFKKGEYAFGNLALGYLDGFKKYLDKLLGKIDYTKFNKANREERDKYVSGLLVELEKIVVFNQPQETT